MALSEQTKRLIWHYRFPERYIVLMACHFDSIARIDKFMDALQSLYNQTVRPDYIYIGYIGNEQIFEEHIGRFNGIKTKLHKCNSTKKWDMYRELDQYVLKTDIVSFLEDIDRYTSNRIQRIRDIFDKSKCRVIGHQYYNYWGYIENVWCYYNKSCYEYYTMSVTGQKFKDFLEWSEFDKIPIFGEGICFIVFVTLNEPYIELMEALLYKQEFGIIKRQY